jgi:very-short-patch-repair endonuclease
MCRKSATPDAVIAMIAARQHGVVSVSQLLAEGIPHHRILYRARTGRFHRVHRGVYAVGHDRLSNEGRLMAAVLACGDAAVLSHRSAAALWGLLPDEFGPVDVTVSSQSGRKLRPGIRLHRLASLTGLETTRRNGIPVTSPARTVADLRSAVAAEQHRRAVRQAGVLGLPVGNDIGIDLTRSELEHRFLRLCRRHQLPLPEVNARVKRFTVDFLWRRDRLIVETDGYRYHRGRQAFEDDRARDLELRLLEYEVLRLSYKQVVDEPEAVSAAVRRLLQR